MELLTEKIGDITVVVLPGEQLDAGNAKEFKREIGPVLEPCSKVVFDLRELRFVDSSGLGAILSCLRQVNAEGRRVEALRDAQAGQGAVRARSHAQNLRYLWDARRRTAGVEALKKAE